MDDTVPSAQAKSPTTPVHPVSGMVLVVGLLLHALVSGPAYGTDTDLEELESLGKVTTASPSRLDNEVTSVGKRSQRASETAAAVFVITPEDIRRSGVTHIGEALRLAPGIQVARIGSSHWAISARGFNGQFSNKLLVLVDGREVYSPSFGGVYWDGQDLPLDSVQRIEVIRGPGASLWGANAVNGVINIITYSAKDTLGGKLKAGGGNQEQGFGSLRYGARLGENTYGRIYARGANRGSFNRVGGGDASDRWSNTQAGFRIDSDAESGNNLMLQGNAYQDRFDHLVLLPSASFPYNSLFRDAGRNSGYNLLGRWRRSLSLSSEISLQAYYDHTYRNEAFATQERDTLDLEMQHRFAWGGRQDITWGLGYRWFKDRFGNTQYVQLEPARMNRQLFSAFLQDEIGLIERELTLTLGAKLQHNDYTGFEGQPTFRLLWTPNPRHTVWGAISRAVRTPTRVECCAQTIASTLPPNQFPGVPLAVVVGTASNPNFQAEREWSYELGYRFKPTSQMSLDLALFYSQYSALRAFGVPSSFGFSGGAALALLKTANLIEGNIYGAELSADWKPYPWLNLQAVYSFQHPSFTTGGNVVTNDIYVNPNHQAYLRTGLNLTPQWDLDFWLRYVDRLPGGFSLLPYNNRVPGYVTLDARLAWRPVDRLELSLVGQNLLSPHHQEFVQEGFGAPPTEIPRSWYLQLSLDF